MKIILILLLVLVSGKGAQAASVMDKAAYLSCMGASTMGRLWRQYAGQDPVRDLTSAIQVLGNPFMEEYAGGEEIYARNPWDLQNYLGRLYLGGGNSSNQGPARNAGPVAVIFFDPQTGEFVRETRVDEEQIDLYRVLDGSLYIPGHDATESWAKGNFYRKKKEDGWEKYRNIPGGLHVYDMIRHDGKLFAALGTRKGAAVAVSTDNGQKWNVLQLGRNRVYTFLMVGGELYAVKRIPTAKQTQRARLKQNEHLFGAAQFNPPDRFIPRHDLTTADFFPAGLLLQDRQKKIVRAEQLGAYTLYIGAYVHNDHQFLPFGLFTATSFEKNSPEVARVCLPVQYRPWDLLVRDEYVYVLVEETGKKGPGVISRVLRARENDLSAWEEYFRFSAATFARSFAMIENDFYFGLGCEIKDPKHWQQSELKPETGIILRIPGSALTGERRRTVR